MVVQELYHVVNSANYKAALCCPPGQKFSKIKLTDSGVVQIYATDGTAEELVAYFFRPISVVREVVRE